MSKINSPLELKNLHLHNRLVMPPMATAKAEEDGRISRDILDYYAEKSQGGNLALIIIEHSYISQEGKAHQRQLSIEKDEYVEDLKKLSDLIHQNGTKAVMQINHAGSATKKEITGLEPVAPSAISNGRKEAGEVPRELSKENIQEIIKSFIQAAVRVKKAGFDGVEIHSAHGYLLNQFYSPLSNKRTDEYGGDVLGRIKIHLEIIRSVREAVGDDFTILLRLGASDYQEGGSTIEDSIQAVQQFEKAGVDILDISGGFCGFVAPGLTDQGYFSPLTKAIKEVVKIPVILTGGITEPQAAEQLLVEEKADLIGVGRAVLNDSLWAKKALKEITESDTMFIN